MNRYEIELKAIDQNKVEHAKAIQELYALEENEKRSLDADERLKVEEHTKAIRVLDEQEAEAKANLKTIEEVDAISRNLGTPVSSLKNVEVGDSPHEQWAKAMNHSNKSLGDVFIESKGYKDVIADYRANGGRFTEGFSTGPVALEAKGTLMEAAGSGGGALAATVPQVVPGVVDKLFQRLTVADLLLQGQASTNSLRYVTEGTATSGATGVAEGGTKPESTLGLITTDEPIKKIATILPVSEEMLEDAPAIQSYINGRLSLFVRIEEERQLLRGTSGGAEVQGLLTSRSVPVYAGGTAAGNIAVQIFQAMNGMRGSAFVEPEWVIMHPNTWGSARLAVDTAGQYFGGGPFQGPYGNGQQFDQSNQLSAAADYMWQKPVYLTATIGAGTTLIGSRASAQVWRRGGLSVEASNSHSTYFQLNLVAIRAEERLGLAVYRSNGFVEVRHG